MISFSFTYFLYIVFIILPSENTVKNTPVEKGFVVLVLFANYAPLRRLYFVPACQKQRFPPPFTRLFLPHPLLFARISLLFTNDCFFFSSLIK